MPSRIISFITTHYVVIQLMFYFCSNMSEEKAYDIYISQPKRMQERLFAAHA